MEDTIQRLAEVLGYDGLLEEVLKALTFDQRLDVITYIARNYDIDTQEE